MNRFCRDISVTNIEKPVKFSEDFSILLTKMESSNIEKGSLKEIFISGLLESAIMSSRY